MFVTFFFFFFFFGGWGVNLSHHSVRLPIAVHAWIRSFFAMHEALIPPPLWLPKHISSMAIIAITTGTPWL